jgi:integrase
LWPETVEALRAAISERPEPKEAAYRDLVFITRFGHPWATSGFSDAVTLETGKLLRKLDFRRPGVGFYALRHTFRTVADAAKDPNAIRLIMGHTDDSIDDNYTHGIDDSRLQAVAEHVRRWLWPKPASKSHSASKSGATSTNAPRPKRARIEGPATDNNERPALRLYVG